LKRALEVSLDCLGVSKVSSSQNEAAFGMHEQPISDRLWASGMHCQPISLAGRTPDVSMAQRLNAHDTRFTPPRVNRGCHGEVPATCPR
jgi:hypothetical protein